MTTPPLLDHGSDARAWRISPDDTVLLMPLRRPSELTTTSVCFEVWEPGGSQPPNSHPDSVETFVFLDGQGIAISDDTEVEVRAGDVLTLPAGSVHRIRNTGPGRMRALTLMDPDEGFVDLIERGTPAELEPADLQVLLGAVRDDASLHAAVADYETSLVAGRADDAADHFARDDDGAVSRFGPTGSAWGHDAIRDVRRATVAPPTSDVIRAEVGMLAPGIGLARAELRRNGTTVLRTQVWQLLEDRWRIVHAHVSNV
ncbi:MAG: AtzH-like domain-containing protein [Actinomycetota bacterium]